MKTKQIILTLFTVFAVLLLIVLLSNNVNAASYDIAQTDLEAAVTAAGEATAKGITYVASNNDYSDTATYLFGANDYTLTGNITLGSEAIAFETGTASLDLGSYTISRTASDVFIFPVIASENVNFTITGTTGKVISECGALDIRGNANVTINGGTYESTLTSGAAQVATTGNVSISGGTFTAKTASAFYFNEVNKLTISGGTFTSEGDNGFECFDAKTITISGGTFTGGCAGIIVPATATVKLSGGKYTANGDYAIGAIVVEDGEDEDIFDDFLVEGYKWSEDLTVGKTNEESYGITFKNVYTQATVSVVKEKNEEEQKPTEENKQEEQKPAEENKQEEQKPAEENKQEEQKPAEENKQEEQKPVEENKQEANVVAEDTENKEDVAAAEEVAKLVDEIIAGKDVEGISKEVATKIKEAKAAGKSIKIEVETPEVAAEKVEEDAKKIDEKIGEKGKIAALFDINILIKADGTLLGKATKLGDKITIALAIPQDLPAVATGYTREFTVVSVHDGEAKEQETRVDGDTIYTDVNEFSTYAITYKDVKNTSNPTTGDLISLYVAAFTVASVGAVVVFKKIK